MKTHPFNPQISQSTTKLLIGTLPPEGVKFYFSNSPNTRLWDILIAINEERETVNKGGYLLTNEEKIAILKKLGIGICDIIYQYERDDSNSVQDRHIEPITYKNILQLATENEVSELLFVYQSAYKWFLHSLKQAAPVRLKSLTTKHQIGSLSEIKYEGKIIKCTLLPSPLNRGTKGQDLPFKLKFYREHIKG